jgi:HlyD family secretion protein
MNDDRQPLGLSQLKIDRSHKATPRKKPWLTPLALLSVVALGAGAYVYLPRTVEVELTSAVLTTPSQQFVKLTASGYVVAQRRAAVASKATGRLVALNVREGSQVKEGDLLAKLDDSDVKAAILGAKANVHQAQANVQVAQVQLINARAELARTRGLQDQGFVSPQMVDNAQAKTKMAVANAAAAAASLEQARAQLQAQNVGSDYTEIRAPFDGVVLVKNANVGDIITPMSSAVGAQSAVVTMADMRTLEVEADVSETNLSQVRIGQPVEVVLDALPQSRFRAHVAGIVPTVDRAKATVMTKVRFDALDPQILPEMSAKVSFLSQEINERDQRAVLAVPASAIVRRASETWVLAVHSPEAGKLVLQEQPVKLGRTLGELVEVSGAIKAGDKLVARPNASLKAGQAVSAKAP